MPNDWNDEHDIIQKCKANNHHDNTAGQYVVEDRTINAGVTKYFDPPK